MKSNYKTNCITLELNCKMNLMRYIRFIFQISTHQCKKFYKQILFDTPINGKIPFM